MMKDFKETLRNNLREQKIPDLGVGSGGKVDMSASLPKPTPTIPVPPAMPAVGGNKPPPIWYKPGRIVPTKPGETWKPPGNGPNLFYYNYPDQTDSIRNEKPGTSNSEPVAGDTQVINGETLILHDDGFWYPAVEVPPGSGNWMIDQSPAPNHPSNYPDSMTYEGNTYVFNVSCHCWQQMVYDSATNSWSWAEPSVTLPDDAVDGNGNPIGGAPIFQYIEVPAGSGNWIQVYPPNMGGYDPSDPTSWPDCQSSHCIQRDSDGNWWHWVSGNPGQWQQGNYGDSDGDFDGGLESF